MIKKNDQRIKPGKLEMNSIAINQAQKTNLPRPSAYLEEVPDVSSLGGVLLTATKARKSCMFTIQRNHSMIPT